MSEITRNKIAAQIIKAEMLGDQNKVAGLKLELEKLNGSKQQRPQGADKESQNHGKHEKTQDPWSTEIIKKPTSRDYEAPHHIIDKISTARSGGVGSHHHNPKVMKFLKSTGSLSQMFAQESKLTASDEAKMFLKTATKFSGGDMETKHFSEEIDDSQVILNKNKRHKTGDEGAASYPKLSGRDAVDVDAGPCYKCVERVHKHLVVDRTDTVYLSLTDSKSFLSHMSNVTISNTKHSGCNSFVSANNAQQEDTERIISSLRDMWESKGYRCIIMETHFKNRRPVRGEISSCGNHFQVHCLPIKEKHYERARMSFKKALQDCEREWSLNKKLIVAEGRRIQRHLPKGLSYFWVCFDELQNGFAHVIEHEEEFSRYFGLEVLSGLLDKDFNPMKLNQREEYKDQFDRCRDFKLLYSQFKPTSDHC